MCMSMFQHELKRTINLLVPLKKEEREFRLTLLRPFAFNAILCVCLFSLIATRNHRMWETFPGWRQRAENTACVDVFGKLLLHQ